MTKINPNPVFVQPENLVNPADLRDGLGWFVYGLQCHARGEKLDDGVLSVVRDTIQAIRLADIMVLDPKHTVERETFAGTLAFSFLHPYGFKITVLEDFGVNGRVIINDDISNPLTIGTMYK